MEDKKEKVKKVKVKKEKIKKVKDKNNSLISKFKKNVLATKITAFIFSVALLALFVVLNVLVAGTDLPEIDLTANKVYTLSDASKEVIKNIDIDVNIAMYGFEENSNFINFVKQYQEANPEHITYELLKDNNEASSAKIQKYGLTPGYAVVFLESGDSYKLIDAGSEFTVFDYTTYSLIDKTEQVLTNGILSLNDTQQKNIYILSGHGEYEEDFLSYLIGVLELENFNIEFINLLSANKEFSPNDVLAILSPRSDLNEIEYNKIVEGINKGLNIIYTQEYVEDELVYFNKLAALYGAKINQGIVVEKNTDFIYSESSLLFMPQASLRNNITADIAAESYMLIGRSGKLEIASEDELNSLKVKADNLLVTTENAAFTKDLEDLTQVEMGQFTIATELTKTIDDSLEVPIRSNMLIVSTGGFYTNMQVSETSSAIIAGVGGNTDFIVNAASEFTNKGDYLTIRKDMSAATYAPTETQNKIVLAIIFIMPVIFIVIGIVVAIVRRRRK